MAERDYYEILGINKDATEDEIKKAYRTLAKKYHPDISTEPNAEEKFKEVQKAYDCLSDPEKRSNYDQFGSEEGNPFGQGGAGFSGFGGFEDIFSSFFGGGRQSRRSPNAPQKGHDLRTNITLTFEEAAFGVKKEIVVNRFETCSKCNGSGAQSKNDVQTCSRCHGTGTVVVEQNTILGRIQTQSTCPECRGKGKKILKHCTECHGEGKIRREARISVNVPAGIDDEQTLRLSGQGEAGINGGPSGDLFINIRVKEHEFFVRDGNDIYIELPVTFSQVALGCTMEVETLNGKVALKIPAGTQTGTKFKMAGRGIQNQTSGRTGNQYVTIKVITPTKLSGEQKDLFEKLSKTNETASSSIFEKFKKFFTKK